MTIKYNIIKKTIVNFKNLVKITRAKIIYKRRREIAPKLKRMNFEKSSSVLTRSVLRDLLFNK